MSKKERKVTLFRDNGGPVAKTVQTTRDVERREDFYVLKLRKSVVLLQGK